jgi:hypothetical protein
MSPDQERSKRNRKSWLATAGFFVGLGTLLVTFYAVQTQLEGVNVQLAEQEKLASAQYVLDLSDKLDTGRYITLADDIDDNDDAYSPIHTGGFTDNQLDDYMGEFETVGDLVRDGVIEQQMAYDEFSYDIEKTYCNDDVQADITRDQASDGVDTGTIDASWSGFQGLAKLFLAKDSETCVGMNEE